MAAADPQSPPPASESGSQPTIELEHAIGFSAVPNSLHYHPNGRDYIYASGGCIVIADFTDPHNQTFLRGHDADVSALKLSPSGRLLASGQYGANADVVVWDVERRELLFRLSEHDVGIRNVGFSHDERLLVSVGDVADGKMFVWDLQTGNIVVSMPQGPSPTDLVAFAGFVLDVKRRDTDNYLLLCAGNRQAWAWSIDPYAGEMSAERLNAGAVVREYTCLALSADNEFLFAGSTTGDVVVYNTRSYKMLTSVSACAGGVLSLASFRGGVLVGGGDGSVTMLDNELRDVGRVQLQGGVSSLSMSADEVEVLAGTDDGSVYRARADQLQECLLLSEAHSAAVVAVAYPDELSDRFATISTDCALKCWDASDYSVSVKAVVRNAGAPTSLAYSLDALFSGWTDGRIRAHNADTGELLWAIEDAHRGGVSAVVLSGNQRFLVSGGAEGDVRVFELRSRELVSHLKEHTMKVTSLAIFSDDVHVMSCSRDRSFLCWDLRRERRISSHTQRMGGINGIALSRDETQVLTVGQDRRVSFWDLREHHPIHSVHEAHDGEVFAVAVSHNGTLVATGGDDQRVKLWDFATCSLLADGVGHSGRITSLQFSPDDRQLVSVGADGGIFIFNVYT